MVTTKSAAKKAEGVQLHDPIKLEASDDAEVSTDAVSEPVVFSITNADLSVPSKVAEALYFQRYNNSEIMHEFPLTVDVEKEGQYVFLVEPRPGLQYTDFYVDNYAWNRGRNTSTKRRIYVHADEDEIHCTRKDSPNAQYVLHWYYANMESRITKKISWLVSLRNNNRVSPVLVHYTVHFTSPHPIEMKKPRLYSDARIVAKRKLESDTPMNVCARFEQNAPHYDPREILSRKQAYDLRRTISKVKDNRGRRRMKRDIDDVPETDMYGYPLQEIEYFDTNASDLYEETVYYEEPEMARQPIDASFEVNRMAAEVVRIASRKVEQRLNAFLDTRLGLAPSKSLPVRVPLLNSADKQLNADSIGNWINMLVEASGQEERDIVIPNVISAMRRRLNEIIHEDGVQLAAVSTTPEEQVLVQDPEQEIAQEVQLQEDEDEGEEDDAVHEGVEGEEEEEESKDDCGQQEADDVVDSKPDFSEKLPTLSDSRKATPTKRVSIPRAKFSPTPTRRVVASRQFPATRTPVQQLSRDARYAWNGGNTRVNSQQTFVRPGQQQQQVPLSPQQHFSSQRVFQNTTPREESGR